MPNAVNITGQRFGRLVAIRTIQTNPTAWEFRCDCGSLTTASVREVRSGNKKSCGCLRVDVVAARNTKHGQSHSALHEVWKTMRQRCLNPASQKFKDYGGRGIRVCPEWDDFVKFCEDMGPRPRGTSIERRDNNGGYCPSNCYWATAEQQSRNKRNNRLISINGQSKTIAEWAELSGLRPALIATRITRLGWNPADAVLTPPLRVGENRSHAA